MDPITAIGLSGNILTFVDYGRRIVSKGYELYKSADGALLENQELSLTASEVQRLASKLIPSPTPDDALADVPESEEALRALCDRCKTLSGELKDLLESLKVKGKHRHWGIVKKSVKTVWNKDKFTDLQTRLVSIRDTVQFRILVDIIGKIDLVSAQTSEGVYNRILDGQISLNQELGETRQELKELGDLNFKIAQVLAMRRDEQSEIMPGLESRASSRVITSLEFSARESRKDQIATANIETFGWLFKSEQREKQTGIGFSQWLERGSGIYWISGATASGKSTLMRYIVDHPLTGELLSNWAKPLPLGTASFFFWASGSMEQKSQAGFLRSVLLEVLQEHQELIPVVLPWHWAKNYLQLVESESQSNPDFWTVPRLMQACKYLMDQKSVPLKICMFIDGLDEYNGDMKKLIKWIQCLSSSTHIKVCISSRPLNVITDAFFGSPGFLLHELTRQDIHRYINITLEKNGRYKQLAEKDQDSAGNITSMLLEASQGNFLWIAIAVNGLLLQNIASTDTIKDLQYRVSLLPPSLNYLYNDLWNRTPHGSLYRSYECLLLIDAAWKASTETIMGELEIEPLTTIALALAMRSLKEDRPIPKGQPMTEDQINDICQNIERWTKRRLMGLFDIQDSNNPYLPKSKGKIQYIHRSALDFLRAGKLKDIQAAVSPEFNPHVVLLRTYIEEVQILPPRHLFRSRWTTIGTALTHAAYIEKYSEIDYSADLDMLDQAIAKLQTSPVNRNHWAVHMNIHSEYSKKCHDNFLSLAVQYGLYRYLKYKIESGWNVVRNKEGRPLLDYIVHFGPKPQPLLVEILLNHGADPNQIFDGFSTWQNLLRFLYSTYVDNDEHQRPEGTRDDLWIDIITMFVMHGASLHKSGFESNKIPGTMINEILLKMELPTKKRQNYMKELQLLERNYRHACSQRLVLLRVSVLLLGLAIGFWLYRGAYL